MVVFMKINCINIQKCVRISHSRLPESVTCYVTRQICFGKRTSDVRNAEETFIHDELQSLAGGHDGQISSTFSDLIVTSPIQVSLLLTTNYLSD